MSRKKAFDISGLNTQKLMEMIQMACLCPICNEHYIKPNEGDICDRCKNGGCESLEPKYPHASDCGIWANDPCDCLTGSGLEEVQDGDPA